MNIFKISSSQIFPLLSYLFIYVLWDAFFLLHNKPTISGYQIPATIFIGYSWYFGLFYPPNLHFLSALVALFTSFTFFCSPPLLYFTICHHIVFSFIKYFRNLLLPAHWQLRLHNEKQMIKSIVLIAIFAQHVHSTLL